ncbi:MAG TPA: STAS domain-containing protein [Tepidisphaeraceae bacterium]|jgi:anti-anti-sigma factor
MSIETRPDDVALVRLADDPQFTEDLDALTVLDPAKPPAVVMEFSGVHYLNSSKLAKLLRLRKRLIEVDGKLVLCGMTPQVGSVFQVTGLDKVFVIADDVPNALRLAGSA